ncbi:hypothetical protein AB0M00_43925 [Streptomyces chartreusis]|uniref:hypothetical protein n=1 Tax=Streptomyces chartreusis TaxID=1969 RepID=UPI003442B356
MPDAREQFLEVLRSRRMMKPGEEWVIDANLNAYAHEVVAATLRTIAEQVVNDDDRASLLDTAGRVERGADDSVCPLCQEVTCDTGCALAQTRAIRAEHRI